MQNSILDPTRLGAILAARRKSLRMTQEELAAVVGVSRQLIGELEKGKPGVNLGLALEVCRQLGVRLLVDGGRD